MLQEQRLAAEAPYEPARLPYQRASDRRIRGAAVSSGPSSAFHRGSADRTPVSGGFQRRYPGSEVRMNG